MSCSNHILYISYKCRPEFCSNIRAINNIAFVQKWQKPIERPTDNVLMEEWKYQMGDPFNPMDVPVVIISFNNLYD